MTYVVQRDSYRCGPVAILNALRWAGKDVLYKSQIGRLTQLCECVQPKGTKYRPFVRTLRKEGKNWFDIELVTEPNFGLVEKILGQGKAAIWNFKHERGRHYAFIVSADRSKKTFSVANYVRDNVPLIAVPREEMKKFLNQHDRLQRLWVLTKLA